MTQKNELVDELVLQIGKHIVARVGSYINHYANGSKANFVNRFIVCLEPEEAAGTIIDAAVQAKQHFDDNVSSDIMDIIVECIRVDEELSLELSLAVLPVFLGRDIDYEDVILKGEFLSSPSGSLQELLMKLSAEDLKKYIKIVINATLLSASKDNT